MLKLIQKNTNNKIIIYLLQVNEVSKDEAGGYLGLVRRSSRISAARDVERVVHLKLTEPSVQKLTEFSDEDDVQFVSESKSRVTTPSEFGGVAGAIFSMFIYPLIALGLIVTCNESHCAITKLPDLQKYKKLSTYIDVPSVAIFSIFLLAILVLGLLPFGGPRGASLPSKQSRAVHVFNGLFSLIVLSVTSFGGAYYFKVPLSDLILSRFFQLCVVAHLYGLLLTVFSYFLSFRLPVSALNPYGVTKSRIYNFYAGRITNYQVLRRLDLKLFCFRAFNFGAVSTFDTS